jgi:hypothetical protein
VTRGTWGGTYRAGDAEVTIYISDAYAEDPGTAERWARVLGGLVHGDELSRLTLVLSPPAEVEEHCQSESYGCYAAGSATIEAIGDGSAGIEPEAVVAHEYGHFVATYRDNPPWDAVEWGPKRWASYAGGCALVAKGRAFPGDQGANYELNPGEAFAESYRLLNMGERKTRWTQVAQTFYPDKTALARVRQDVLDPWLAPTTVRLTGGRSYRVATPLDGPVEVAVPRGVTLQSKPRLRRAGQILRGTVCGTRTLELRLSRPAPLTVTRP